MTNFIGTPGNDLLDAATETLDGFSGGTATDLVDLVGDVIVADGGDDVIRAGAGDDTITGGAGDDVIDGEGVRNDV